MRKTYYTEEPTVFYRDKYRAEIRLDIQQESSSNEDSETAQWSATVIPAFEPLSQNKFIEAAMSWMYGNDYENKLINEYNAAKMGLYPDGEMEQKITRYRAFLQERAERKAEIERICTANGIN